MNMQDATYGCLFRALSQLCELERLLQEVGTGQRATRCIEKMKDAFAELQLFYEYPLGEQFSETRTDVEAHISGDDTEDLRIVEVIKPIIRRGTPERSMVVQKGVVVVSCRNTEAHNG